MNITSIPRIYIYKQLVEAKLFIDANFREKIDLELIANQACFSKYHFHRLFKECYHKTPLEYITYLRLNEAKLLLSKGISILDVCCSIGFESTSSFIKLFKKNLNMTPLEFSNMRITKRKNIERNPLHYIPTHYAQYLGWVAR